MKTRHCIAVLLVLAANLACGQDYDYEDAALQILAPGASFTEGRGGTTADGVTIAAVRSITNRADVVALAVQRVEDSEARKLGRIIDRAQAVQVSATNQTSAAKQGEQIQALAADVEKLARMMKREE